MEDDFNWQDFVDSALDNVDDPFQNPPAADDAMQGQAFGDQPIEQPVPVNAAPPVDDPMPVDMGRPFGGYSANPYELPEMRRQDDGYEDPGSKLMRAALGQVGEKMGGDYFRSGGREWGQDPVDMNGREQGPRGGMAQLDPSETLNYSRTGTDMSGNNPVFRAYNFTDDDPLVSKPIRDFNDYRSIPSPFSKMYDQNNELMLDENGRQRYNDLPGFDYRKVAGAGLTPTTLENGQPVMYDPFNNMTFGTRGGEPGQLLAGGLGLDGATRQQANYYGWNPTTDARGNPVYYDEAGNRTFQRNRDGSAGRQILDVNRDPRFLDGGRAGGGQGGSGGGSFSPNRFNPPPPPPPPDPPVRAVDGGESGTIIQLNGGQIAVPAGGQAVDLGDSVEVTRADGQKITYDKNGKVITAPSTPTQFSERDVLGMNAGPGPNQLPVGTQPRNPADLGGPATYTPSSFVGPDGNTYRDEAEFTQAYGMSPSSYRSSMAEYEAQRNKGNYARRPPLPRNSR